MRYVVVDEADTLLEPDFKEDLDAIFAPIRKRLATYEKKEEGDEGKEVVKEEKEEGKKVEVEELLKHVQFTFVCATLTKQLTKVLLLLFSLCH